MKHPYESGGIMFTIAILGGILGGVAFDNFAGDMHNGVHEYVSEKVEKIVKSPASSSWSDYYKNNNDVQLDCKKTSTTLQEFYDCVNG
jgi:hypothetical protein